MKRSWAFTVLAAASACTDTNTPLGDASPSDAGTDAMVASDAGFDAGRDLGFVDVGFTDLGFDDDGGVLDSGQLDATIDDGGSNDGGVSQYRYAGLGLSRKRTSCGIDDMGEIVCWGRQDNPPPAGQFQWIDGGDGYMCGLRLDGTIACWITANAQSMPTDPELSPPPGNFTRLVAAKVHACALDSSGNATCWGSEPTAITSPPGETFTDLAADDDYTCGLTPDGRILCWGDGTPSNVPTGTGFRGIGAGDNAGCAITAADELMCFGLASPFLGTPPAGPFAEVDVAEFSACARRRDGTLACFGPNGPELNAPAGMFSRVEMGQGWGCALGDDQTIRCWGDNFYGQIDVP